MAIYVWEQPDEPPRKFYGTRYLADMLDVTQHTITNLIKRGRLRAVRVGHQWRIAPEDLDEFLGKRQ